MGQFKVNQLVWCISEKELVKVLDFKSDFYYCVGTVSKSKIKSKERNLVDAEDLKLNELEPTVTAPAVPDTKLDINLSASSISENMIQSFFKKRGGVEAYSNLLLEKVKKEKRFPESLKNKEFHNYDQNDLNKLIKLTMVEALRDMLNDKEFLEEQLA